MTNDVNKWIKKARKKQIKALGGKCAYCGISKDLHLAHIKPTKLNGQGRGRKERYYDVKKNRASYVLLCGKEALNCHEKFDKGVIKL